MRILINATNLGGGGGLQVADSICRYLNLYPSHKFVCVLSSRLEETANAIRCYKNVILERYNYPTKHIKSFITGHNAFLDSLVDKYDVECVLTIFGPMKWKPRCPHVCGFALSQLVLKDSPYFKILSLKRLFKEKCRIKIWEYLFFRGAEFLFTENQLITELLQKKFPQKKVYTITNNYNQVFDQPSQWKYHSIPPFDGKQLLCVTTPAIHKNVTIALDVASILKKTYPDFRFRFVFTFDEGLFGNIPEDLKECFFFTGKIPISECPSLYEQCDYEFQPTLLECFTATYPEAMIMNKPIITTNTEFAHGICGDAAIYYDPLSPSAAASAIYQLSNDISLQNRLIMNGRRQLDKFDTSSQRVDKLINLCKKCI